MAKPGAKFKVIAAKIAYKTERMGSMMVREVEHMARTGLKS